MIACLHASRSVSLLRRPRSAWVYSITQHCTAVYCIYSGIEWHYRWLQKIFWRIIFAYIFGQNILVPYFGKFSHLELPDNIGRIRSLHLMLFLCFFYPLLRLRYIVVFMIGITEIIAAFDHAASPKQERKSILQYYFGSKWCLWNECDTSTESECCIYLYYNTIPIVMLFMFGWSREG